MRIVLLFFIFISTLSCLIFFPSYVSSKTNIEGIEFIVFMFILLVGKILSIFSITYKHETSKKKNLQRRNINRSTEEPSSVEVESDKETEKTTQQEKEN